MPTKKTAQTHQKPATAEEEREQARRAVQMSMDTRQ